MSDEYFDIDGNKTSLYKMIRNEPDWAENCIKQLKAALAEKQAEIDRYREQAVESANICDKYKMEIDRLRKERDLS